MPKAAGMSILTLQPRQKPPLNKSGFRMNKVPVVRDEYTILPEQFFGSGASLSAAYPEAALMRAVLKDALVSFQRLFDIKGSRTGSDARQDEEWFFSEESRPLFSFVSICEVLGLERESIRRRLKRLS